MSDYNFGFSNYSRSEISALILGLYKFKEAPTNTIAEMLASLQQTTSDSTDDYEELLYNGKPFMRFLKTKDAVETRPVEARVIYVNDDGSFTMPE